MAVLHYASSAVSVAQRQACKIDAPMPVMRVGNLAKLMNHHSMRMPPVKCVGLLQFPPLSLPVGYKITSAHLCLMVYETFLRPVRIALFQNLSGYCSQTVTYETRPAIAQKPFAIFQVNPDMQWKYAACDVTALYLNHHGDLPAMGFTLAAIDALPCMVSFCAHNQAYMPYLEIVCSAMDETKDECDANAEIAQNIFKERIFHIDDEKAVVYTPTLCTSSAEQITFFVKNTGTHAFSFHIQISPDGLDYIDDPQVFAVEPGDMKAAVPYLFGKFMRACMASNTNACFVAARIWFQAQTKNYMVKEIAYPLGSGISNSLPMSLPGDVIS